MKPGSITRFLQTRRTLFISLVLGLSTLMVYWRVGKFDFLNFDDQHYVFENPYVTGGLTAEGFSWALKTSFHDFWHPVTWWSHMLDCELFGLHSGIHHLVNAGFHTVNTLLLFLLLARTTGAFWRSAIVAGLFALHPTHVESVAWVAERKDVLSGLFFFLTLWAYVSYTERLRPPVGSGEAPATGPEEARPEASESNVQPSAAGRAEAWPDSSFRSSIWKWSLYGLALVFFALGLMSKPMLVTLPFVLLLLDYWPLGRYGSQRSNVLAMVREKVPFLALALASSIITYLGMKAGRHLATSEQVPWVLRWANVPVSYARYLWKLLWPGDLAVLYPMPQRWPWWLVAGALVALLVISWFVLRRTRSAPYLAVGWALFLGMLTPVIGIVSNGFQSMADRYLYLPAIGFFIAVVWGLAEWPEVHPSKRRVQCAALPAAGGPAPGTDSEQPRPLLSKVMIALLALVVLAACAAQTWRQLDYWRNSLALWTRCLDVTRDNIIAHYNLGFALQVAGRTDEGIGHFRQALRINPDDPVSNLNLGSMLQEAGRAQEATNYLAQALQLNPREAKAQENMGLALLDLGDFEHALAYCIEAIRLEPRSARGLTAMGRAMSGLGKSDEALRYYSEALALAGADPQVHYHLGLEWMKRGLYGLACSSFQQAASLAPAWADAQTQLARARAAQKQ